MKYRNTTNKTVAAISTKKKLRAEAASRARCAADGFLGVVDLVFDRAGGVLWFVFFFDMTDNLEVRLALFSGQKSEKN
jgi:hypothetical protein